MRNNTSLLGDSFIPHRTKYSCHTQSSTSNAPGKGSLSASHNIFILGFFTPLSLCLPICITCQSNLGISVLLRRGHLSTLL